MSCPSCGARLEAGVEACPNCPWSSSAPGEQDPAPGLPGARLRPFAVPALVLALFGAGIWAVSDMWLRLAQQGAADALADRPAARRALEGEGAAPAEPRRRDEAAPAPEPEIPVILSDTPAEPRAPRRPRTARESSRRRAVVPADAEEAAGVISISGQGLPEAKEAAEWRLRGRIFDLITLAPVPGARVTFMDEPTGARAETSTDAEGRYKTLLPALSGRGYQVKIEKKGYARSYAGPETPGVAELDPASRAELARQLARSVEDPASLEPGGEEPLLTNFFLAPLAN